MEQSRLDELLSIEQEYKQLKALIEHAANEGNLENYAGETLLYVEPETGKILDANAATLKFLGYTMAELQEVRIDVLESKTKETIKIFENKQPFEVYEANYRHKDGFQLPVKVRSRQIIPLDRKILRYSLEDKSLHSQLWRELSRREDSNFHFREQLKTLYEINLELGKLNSLDELCRRSIELGRERLGFDRLSIWFINRSSKRMVGSFGVDETGQIRDERGQSWSYHGGDIEEFLHGRREPMIVSDAPLYNERSEYIGYGWHVSVPLLDADEFIGFMGVDNYINKQALKAYQPDLLRLFGASIGHLAAVQREQETIRQMTLEQERLRLLGTFVKDIGHEFKTPLTIIKTSTYFLAKPLDEEKRQSQVAKIDESVEYIDHLLTVMLEMVKLDSQPELKLSSVRLDHMLADILNHFAPRAEAKEIELLLEASPESINADKQLLWRAIEAVIRNAIDYTSEGGKVAVRLSTRENEYSIIVEDTGVGIAADELDKIFQRFYRVDSARSSRNAGLGLTIAKRIIELHQGSIYVNSIAGKGSRFEICLPRS